MIHIDPSEKREGLPELGQSKHCGRTGCPHPDFYVGFGLAGGGYGTYEFCDACERIVAKTLSEDE